MPRGSKAKYSSKQKREAEHIEEGYEKRGVKSKEAKRRAWATVNKTHGGGSRGGSSGALSAPSPPSVRVRSHACSPSRWTWVP